ncbi:ARPP-1 family domain-containing protein [Desulfatirhabdium butyrativorans]|uniref:ARPP-1 family domain-containing protein n=1 Tax=Desulfatirhabdium butyrativorans TaxID=340467 RepID=UPI000481FF57|nr:DUF6569 family protein [Desulfatirhabdium butyrativorans]
MHKQNLAANWFQNNIQIGEILTHREISILPLHILHIAGPDYVSLKSGIKQGLIITEIGQEGSVPVLKAQNPTGIPVLILDGEELTGAKQNRVLNTTILIQAGASIEIPVSCTEQGRWRWDSKRFEDSGVLMAPAMRSRKNESVRNSLKSRGSHDSNQMRIWEDIGVYLKTHDAHSETRAMKYAFEKKRNDSKTYTEAFPWQEGQCGMIALIRGNVVSLELVSRPEVYRDIHEKMIESLVMDIPLWKPADRSASMKHVEIFLDYMKTATEEFFPAVGAGTDVRYRGHHLIGSALVVENWMLHLSLYHQSTRNSAFHPDHHHNKYPSFDDFGPEIIR